MLKRLFVTGTDTEVGKTVVSRALLQKLAAQGKQAVGYKPVAKSSQQTEEGPRNKDALVLQASSSILLPYQAINPVTLLEDEISTSRTPIDYATLSHGLRALDGQADYTVVEGTGGWRSLMNVCVRYRNGRCRNSCRWYWWWGSSWAASAMRC